MDYRDSAPAASPPAKKPFAYQAATVAVWAPLIGLALGFLVNTAFSNNKDPAARRPEMVYVWGGVFAFNVLMWIVSITMAVIALRAIRKLGARGLLMRSVVGLAMSAFFIAVTTWILIGYGGAPIASRLPGEWEGRVQIAGRPFNLHLSLQADKHATVTVTSEPAPDGSTRRVQAEGQWAAGYNPDTRVNVLAVKFNQGEEGALGAGLQWQVQRADKNELTLVERQADGAMVTHVLQRK